MDIGKESEPVYVEPIPEPHEAPVQEPTPQAPPVREPEKVPA